MENLGNHSKKPLHHDRVNKIMKRQPMSKPSWEALSVYNASDSIIVVPYFSPKHILYGLKKSYIFQKSPYFGTPAWIWLTECNADVSYITLNPDWQSIICRLYEKFREVHSSSEKFDISYVYFPIWWLFCARPRQQSALFESDCCVFDLRFPCMQFVCDFADFESRLAL